MDNGDKYIITAPLKSLNYLHVTNEPFEKVSKNTAHTACSRPPSASLPPYPPLCGGGALGGAGRPVAKVRRQF